jgi:hypothetical protein
MNKGRAMAEKTICIFCGKKADVTKHGQLKLVICEYCHRETELDEYQEILNQWLQEIIKEEEKEESQT